MEDAENTRFIYQFGEFTLNPQEKTLFLSGKPIHLPQKEFETLRLLVENNGRALSKEEIISQVWQETIVEENNLAKQISRLRKLLNINSEVQIETLPKHGYRFSAQVNRISPVNEESFLEKHTIKRVTVRVEEDISNPPPILPPIASKFSNPRFFVIFGLAVLAIIFAVWYWSKPSVQTKINSIAVLPIKSLVKENDTQILQLGLTDALITKIGSLPELSVRPMSSVIKFNESEKDALEIGKTLNVDAVLEATIQQADGRIRINVRLLRTANGEQIWTEKFEGESTKIFDLEDRLSEQTARALGLKLGVKENEHLTKRFTNNPQAFDDYLKGRFFWNKRTEEGFRKAIEYFNQATQKDPNYSLAYSGLADCYILLGVWGAEKPKDVFPQAHEFTEKALQSDSGLTEAMVSRAFVKWVYDWNWRGADEDFQRAIKLNPNYATAHHWYSYFLISNGRADEAIAEIKMARELEGPLNISVNTDIGEIYSWAGRYDEAEQYLREVLQIEPNYAVAHHVLAINLLKQNRFQEAVAEAETAHRLENEPRVLAVLAYAYAANGELEKALKTTEELNELSKQKYVSPFSKAIALIGLGETKPTISELEKAYSERSDTMAIISVYPLLENLRDNPEFIEIQRRVSQKPQ
jgi:DNA-binding winged helix-turn-helix (wHTH) protein/TolB-like protein/Tfp pilus assembly protein PilF